MFLLSYLDRFTVRLRGCDATYRDLIFTSYLISSFSPAWVFSINLGCADLVKRLVCLRCLSLL